MVGARTTSLIYTSRMGKDYCSVQDNLPEVPLITMCATLQEIHRIQKTQGLRKERSSATHAMMRMLLYHNLKQCSSGSITGWWIYFQMNHSKKYSKESVGIINGLSYMIFYRQSWARKW